MRHTFSVTGTGAAPDAALIASVANSLGFGRGRMVGIEDAGELTVDVTVEMPGSNRLSERMLEKARMEAKGLPEWAGSYPWSPEPYWDAVRVTEDIRRLTIPPAPPKAVW